MTGHRTTTLEWVIITWFSHRWRQCNSQETYHIPKNLTIDKKSCRMAGLDRESFACYSKREAGLTEWKARRIRIHKNDASQRSIMCIPGIRRMYTIIRSIHVSPARYGDASPLMRYWDASLLPFFTGRSVWPISEQYLKELSARGCYQTTPYHRVLSYAIYLRIIPSFFSSTIFPSDR